jgi:DNA-binding GntR family transcriptional regulator
MSAAGETVGQTAYAAIRTDIIFGRLQPSRRLQLENARTHYGVSVSTLREILNRLTSEGFVVAEGQRGFQVAPVSPEGFKEVAGMRTLLECHAIERSLVRGDIEWEGTVVAAFHKLCAAERSMASGDRSMSETWKRYDREFHRAIISACGSEVLMDAHAAIYDQYLRYQMVAVIYRGEVAASEHRKLCEAAIARDVAKARATLVQHIEDCVSDALARPDAPWLTALPSTGWARKASRAAAPVAARTRKAATGRDGTARKARTRVPGRAKP